MFKKNIVNIILTILLLEGFWGLIFKGWYMVITISIILLPSIVQSLYSSRKEIRLESNWLVCYFGALFMSVISSYIFRKQTIIQSLGNTELLWFFYFFSFFYFNKFRLTASQIEKVIDVLFILFSISYLLQYFVFYPREVFTMLAFTGSERRFRMTGQLIVFIGFFLYLNRLLMGNNKINNLLKLLISGFIIVLLGFRTEILVLILTSLLLIIRIKGFNLRIFKYISVIVVLAFALYSTESGKTTIDNMIQRNEESNFSNSDYIRVQQWDYFTNYHFKSTAERFWGTGLPSWESTYGKQLGNLADFSDRRSNVHTSIAQWRDWGLIGLSWVMGVPMFLVLIGLIFYFIFLKTTPNYYYLSSLYLFLLFASITTVEFYRNGAFVFHGLILYLANRIRAEKSLYYKNDENRNYYTTSIK